MKLQKVILMKMLSKLACTGLCACLGIVVLTGCSAQQNKEPDFSNVKEVAELSSLECYYHNVVRYHKDAEGLLSWTTIGEKNMWFEYDGIVRMGINIDKVTISKPDANNVVTITIPEVEVLGRPDVDTDSMTEPVEANGWFTGMTAEDKKQALKDAQNDLLTTAQNDTQSKAQAMQRAKDLLEQYVKNTGEAVGKSYTVKWEQATTDSSAE